jgi:PAS domain S-box-containing protein
VQNKVTHGRQLKIAFIVLAAMLLVSQLSSILLLNGVLHTEEEKIRLRLGGFVDGILHVWSAGGCDLETADTLVGRVLHSDALSAVWLAEYHDSTGWRIRRFGETDVLPAGLGGTPEPGNIGRSGAEDIPYVNADYEIGGRLYRSFSTTRIINGFPIVVGAAVPIPTVARLRGLRDWDFILRAGILVMFIWFALQFFRLIFVPYQKMRAQAERLSGSECLAGPKSDDVEYVMEAFAAAVARLTRQKDNLQQEFDQSKKRYENLEKFNTYILNSMSAGILIFDRQGTVLRLNPSAGRILGLDSAEVIGRSYHDLAQRFPELGTVLEAGLQDARTFVRREITISLLREPGEKRYLGITTSLIYNDAEKIVGISVLLTDLTEIKRLQADLENNRRLADLGEMAAGLAHQLRNSMTAIVGFGRLLRSKVAGDEKVANTVDDVLLEAAESEQMLAQFLNFARPMSLENSPVSLSEIIDRAAEMVHADLEEHQVKLTVQRAGTDDTINADSLMLRQVFVNLFQNAAEAIGKGGRIDVRLYPPVQGAGEEPGRHWLVRVGDNGPGIPGNDHEKIFRPFVTSKQTGTGLGLAVARKIVLCHGGYLSVESSTPAGTVFLLRLLALQTSIPEGTLQKYLADHKL